MKLKMLAVAAALVLSPVAAFAMDCCKDCVCCNDKAAVDAHQH